MIYEARIRKDQDMLDCFYIILKKKYTNASGKLNTKKTDSRGRTIFYWAILCHQNVETMNCLLNQGSRLNERYFGDEHRPIHIAAIVDHAEALTFFIKKEPTDIELNNFFGLTPLLCAAQAGSCLAFATLFNSGANINSLFNLGNKGAIHYGARNGHLGIVKFMIEKNIGLLNALSGYRYTLLMYAVIEGHLPVVRYFLSFTQQIDLEVQVAGYMLSNWDLSYLLNGRTVLHFAASLSGDRVDIVDALLQSGASPLSDTETDKEKPIHLAVEFNNLSVVKRLIDANLDLLNIANYFGMTPLMIAVAKGNLKMAQALLSYPTIDLLAETKNHIEPYKNGLTVVKLANKPVTRNQDIIIGKMVKQHLIWRLKMGIAK